MRDTLLACATVDGASNEAPPTCAALMLLSSATNSAATAPTEAAKGGSCRVRVNRINDPTPYATTTSAAASDVTAHVPGND